MFLDKKFTERHRFLLITKKYLVFIKVIDGRSLKSGYVIEETIPLNIFIGRHQNVIIFNVIESLSNPMILGLSWLDRYNPTIDWTQWKLDFEINVFINTKTTKNLTKNNYLFTSMLCWHLVLPQVLQTPIIQLRLLLWFLLWFLPFPLQLPLPRYLLFLTLDLLGPLITLSLTPPPSPHSSFFRISSTPILPDSVDLVVPLSTSSSSSSSSSS